MSASLKPEPTGGGWLWSAPELARAKELRREGFTAATIAGTLKAEFGTIRSAMSVQQVFTNLRRLGQAVAPAPMKQVMANHAKRQAELVVANTVRRECLSGGRGHWFDSEGAHHRICSDCKRQGSWW